MYEEEYFDDEDLINDYMDDVEPPPIYDEALVDAFEAQALSNEQRKDEGPRETENEPYLEQHYANSHNQEQPLSDVPAIIHVRQASDRAVYSFERYQVSNTWRTEPNSVSNTSTAKRWKSLASGRASLANETGLLPDIRRSKKPTAPDAQLVEFWSRTQRKGCLHKISVCDQSKDGMRLRPFEGDDSISMTLGDGTRVYVKTSKNPLAGEKPTTAKPTSGATILGMTMSELLRRSDAILRKAEHRDQSRKARKQNTGESQPKESNPIENSQGSKSEAVKPSRCQDSQLWVDKHSPVSFSHLLSDDRTNREVLRALRAWDPYVFRKEPPRRSTHSEGKKQMTGKESSESTNANDSSEKRTRDVRPDESNRVILLSGPPGVGKTTLAHIIARHAGYRPLEVNASDERSETVLKDRVVRAMESATLNLSNKSGKFDEMCGRPNCLILDEIDGADAKGAIASLVEIIRSEIPAPGSKGGRSKKPYLRRPIIFICNHKYAPALRPLLPFARQFDVGPPSSTRLVARLRSVLAAETMTVVGGSSLLNQLVAGTAGDIRSCLYALQFASARAREVACRKQSENIELKRDATVVDISSSLKNALGGDGMKDERSDVSGTVTAVFRKSKEGRIGDLIARGERPKSVERVLQLVESFGDNSKTLDCLFTNLLQVSYVDPTLDRCTLAHEWLSGADIYRSNKTAVASNNHMEHHAMQRYHMSSAAAAVHLLCRVETRTELTFSTRQMQDARYKLEANDSLAQKFVDGLEPRVRAGICNSVAVIETIPYSLWMLSAGDGSCSLNRAVSSLEILNKNELVAFNAHVATLRSLGLTYVACDHVAPKSYNETGQAIAMRLEPQIDRVVQFEALSLSPSRRRKEVPSVLKELLAHQASVQGIREREVLVQKVETLDNSGTPSSAAFSSTLESQASSVSTRKHKPEKTADVPPLKRAKRTAESANFLGIGAAKAKAARTARKAALVGFDRSVQVKMSNSGSGIPHSHVIRFKYQKGFTQAVRTPCRVEDLV